MYRETRYKVCQVSFPDPDSLDVRPMLDGDGIHCGQIITAMMPDGQFHDVRVEMYSDMRGLPAWYVASPAEFKGLTPIGLFCRVEEYYYT